MGSKQLTLVQLDGIMDELGSQLEDLDVTLSPADDLDEAVELASLTGVDLMLATRAAADDDPVEVVARAYAEIDDREMPFVFLDPDPDSSDLLVVRRPDPRGDFSLDSYRREELGPLVRALLSPEGLVPPRRSDSDDPRKRLAEIGLEDVIRSADRALTVQTEVHAEEPPSIRATVHESGRLLVARSYPALSGEEHAASEVRGQALAIHRQACRSVARNLGIEDWE